MIATTGNSFPSSEARNAKGPPTGGMRRANLNWAWFAAALFLSMLSQAPRAASAEASLLLADPQRALEEAWNHRIFGAATDYSRVTVAGRPVIRATGINAASGLYREVSYRLADYPWLEWTWRVDQLQAGADIRTKAGQDFAASVFLIFEERMLMMMTHTWTLSYVWTNGRVTAETVVPSPHAPETSRAIVVESGTGRLGQWVREKRNVAADFRRAFGREPAQTVKTLVLFTDSDQTGETAEAYYGAVRAVRE